LKASNHQSVINFGYKYFLYKRGDELTVRKKNTFGVSLSDKALKVLQVMGYVRGDKKVHKDKNMSKFISGLIEDHIIFHPGLNEHEINMKVHIADLNELRRQQDTLQDKMSLVASKLAAEKVILKSREKA